MLTDREEQVLLMLAEGCGLREIGGHLRIAEGTARIHKERAIRKLGAANQTNAVAILLRTRDATPR